MAKIISILLLFLSLKGYAQNLLPNSSFEDTVVNCYNLRMVDPGYPTIRIAKHWYNPSGTPDTFGASNFEFCPYNGYNLFNKGNVYPSDGINYVGFATYQWGFDTSYFNIREYLGTRLIQPLDSGKHYCFSADIRLWHNCMFGVNNFGIYVCTDSLGSNMETDTIVTTDSTYIFTYLSHGVLNYEPIANSETVFSDTSWSVIKLEFIANGHENFIYFGNFFHDSLTDTVRINPNTSDYSNASYYLIDNLSLTLCPGQEEPAHFTIYPNPSNGNTLYIDKYADTTAQISLYNALGQQVGVRHLPAGAYKGAVFEQLASGVYVVVYVTANGYREEKKVVVI